jgi:hypothetical protein
LPDTSPDTVGTTAGSNQSGTSNAEANTITNPKAFTKPDRFTDCTPDTSSNSYLQHISVWQVGCVLCILRWWDPEASSQKQ